MVGSKTVGSKELENNPKPGAVSIAAAGWNSVLAKWAQTGVVTLPKRAKTKLPKSPVRLPKGTAARLRRSR